MKKHIKILSLLICFIMLISAVSVIVFATESAKSSILSSNSEAVSFDDKKLGFKVTNGIKSGTNNGLIYSKWQTDGYDNSSGSQGFIMVGHGGTYDSTPSKNKNTRFAVYEMDISTDSKYIPMKNAFADIALDDKDGTRWIDKSDDIEHTYLTSDGVVRGNIDGTYVDYNMGAEPYDWHHLTFIYDMETNMKVTLIDGNLVERFNWRKKDLESGIQKVGSYRWHIERKAPVVKDGYSLLIANSKLRLYENTSPLKYVTNPNFKDLYEHVNIFDTQLDVDSLELDYNTKRMNNPLKKEQFYETNGTMLRDFDKIVELANGGTVKILADLHQQHKITKDVTIDKNGHEFNYVAPGFIVMESGDIITFTKTNKKIEVTFDYGDGQIVSKFLAGTEIVAPKVPNQKVIDGVNCSFVGWAQTPDGKLIGDLGLAEKNLTLYAVYKNVEAVIVNSRGDVRYFETFKDLAELLFKAEEDSTVRLFRNVEQSGAVYFKKNVTIDLNGFELKMLNDRCSMNPSAKNVVFTNGKIRSATGKNFVYFDEHHDMSNFLTFDGIELSGWSTFTDVRSGTTTFRNCVFNIESGRNPLGGAYRGVKYKYVIENTVFNILNADKKLGCILDQGRASDEKKPLETIYELRGVTVNGDLDYLISAQNKTDGATSSSINLSIDKNCKFNGTFGFKVLSNIPNNITMELGTKMYSAPSILGTPNLKIGDGEYAFAKTSFEYYEAIRASEVGGNITWTVDGVTSTDVWKKGAMPELVGDGWKYVTDKPVLPVDGDATYTATLVYEDIALSANMTLYSDFTFNVYIEKIAGIKSITLGGKKITDLASLKTWDKYYVVSVEGINPLSATEDIVLVIERAYKDGGSFDETHTLGILPYSKAILEGSYSQESKTLVADMILYIKKSMQAYNRTASAGSLILDETFLALVDANASKTVVPDSSASMEAVKGTLESAQLKLDTATKLRFNIVSGANATVVLEYTKNGATVKEEIAIVDGLVNGASYIEIELRAYDLLGDIKVTVGEGVGTYNLATYYSAINATEDKAMADAIASLYAYASSAKAYADSRAK